MKLTEAGAEPGAGGAPGDETGGAPGDDPGPPGVGGRPEPGEQAGGAAPRLGPVGILGSEEADAAATAGAAHAAGAPGMMQSLMSSTRWVTMPGGDAPSVESASQMDSSSSARASSVGQASMRHSVSTSRPLTASSSSRCLTNRKT